jgi:hypothetical protein
MKAPRLLLAAASIVAIAFTTHAADRPPALPIDGALKIAKDYLKGRADSPAIVALTLENATLRGETYWYVKWASPILGGDKPELGLRIDMNGEVTKIVGGGAAPSVGRQRVGARNIR